jgi:hypothetical protein
MRAIYGLTYPEAIALHDSYRPGINGAIPESVLNRGLPDASSPELEAMQISAQVANIYTQKGQFILDEKMDELRRELEYLRIYLSTGRYPSRTEIALREAQENYNAAIANGTDAEFKLAGENLSLAQAHNADMYAPVTNNLLADAVNVERFLRGRNYQEIGGQPTFFSNNAGDKDAYGKFTEYMLQPEDSPAWQAANQFYSMLKTFTPEQVQRANETDAINRAIPSVNNDREGLELLRRMVHLLEELGITINL